RGCWSCRRARSTRAWRVRWKTSGNENGSAMPSELERRLEQALTDVPVAASSDAHDRARAAALSAAAGPAPGRGSHWRVVIAAAVAMVLVTAGVTLAAT